MNSYPKILFAKIAIRGCQLNFKLDSWSTVNIVSDTDYMRVQDDSWLNTLENSANKLLMYNQTEIKTLGKKQSEVTNPKNKTKYMLQFVVDQKEVHPLHGAQALQLMRFITVNNSESNR